MILLYTLTPYIMSNNPNQNNYYLYDKIDENENSSLYKIDFRTLIVNVGHWSYNRPLKLDIINNLNKIHKTTAKLTTDSAKCFKNTFDFIYPKKSFIIIQTANILKLEKIVPTLSCI